MLSVSKLEKSYGSSASRVLKGIRFTLPLNSYTALLGHSGSGKSTLLHLLAGLTTIDAGEITWNGKTIKGPKEKLIPGEHDISLVSQNDELMPHHTVYEQMEHKIRHLTEAEKNKRIKTLSNLLGLKPFVNRKTRELSGGERQRVNLGIQLLAHAPLLLLDEPFTFLDTKYRQNVYRWLMDLKDIGNTTLVMATHQPLEAFSVCSETIMMKNGRIVYQGSLEKAYKNPKDLYTAEMLGEAELLEYQSKKVITRPDWWRVQEKGIQVEILHCQFVPTGYKCVVKDGSGHVFQILLHEFQSSGSKICVGLKHLAYI